MLPAPRTSATLPSVCGSRYCAATFARRLAGVTFGSIHTSELNPCRSSFSLASYGATRTAVWPFGSVRTGRPCRGSAPVAIAVRVRSIAPIQPSRLYGPDSHSSPVSGESVGMPFASTAAATHSSATAITLSRTWGRYDARSAADSAAQRSLLLTRSARSWSIAPASISSPRDRVCTPILPDVPTPGETSYDGGRSGARSSGRVLGSHRLASDRRTASHRARRSRHADQLQVLRRQRAGDAVDIVRTAGNHWRNTRRAARCPGARDRTHLLRTGPARRDSRHRGLLRPLRAVLPLAHHEPARPQRPNSGRLSRARIELCGRGTKSLTLTRTADWRSS